jgi:hypothetical protein
MITTILVAVFALLLAVVGRAVVWPNHSETGTRQTDD